MPLDTLKRPAELAQKEEGLLQMGTSDSLVWPGGAKAMHVVLVYRFCSFRAVSPVNRLFYALPMEERFR